MGLIKIPMLLFGRGTKSCSSGGKCGQRRAIVGEKILWVHFVYEAKHKILLSSFVVREYCAKPIRFNCWPFTRWRCVKLIPNSHTARQPSLRTHRHTHSHPHKRTNNRRTTRINGSGFFFLFLSLLLLRIYLHTRDTPNPRTTCSHIIPYYAIYI